MAPTFIESPILTTLAMNVPNNEYVADMILPRVAVEAEVFSFDYHPIEEQFTAPENEISEFGAIPQLATSSKQRFLRTADYGFSGFISTKTRDRAEIQRRAGLTSYDPEASLAERMMTAHRLRREIRTASLLSNQANFATNELLTAGSQFSDTAFDPIEYFGALRERIPVECNKMVITPRGLRALRSNPILVESITSSGAGANARGRISKEAVAELLELEEIVVMGARTNTVELSNPLAPAPTVGLRRILGNVAALIRVDSSVRSATNDRMTWGMTATYQGMSVSKRFNDGIGARGVDELKLIENSKEIVAAPIAGVLIRNIHPAEATLSVDQLNAYAGQQYEGV